jgi:hypothetical protein
MSKDSDIGYWFCLGVDVLLISVSGLHTLNADPDPAFSTNADPDPILDSNPGVTLGNFFQRECFYQIKSHLNNLFRSDCLTYAFLHFL